MRTIKVTFIPEKHQGMKMILEVDTVVGTPEEAEGEGAELSEYIRKFLAGFGGESE